MTTLHLNLRELLEQACGQATLLVPAEIELDELLDFNNVDTCTQDLNDLLTEQRLIAAVWSVPDVLELRPDLNEDQAWQVLQHCREEYDPLVGLCRSTVARAAAALFSAGNHRRADRCQLVLATYNDEWDTEANLIDLLADSRHWCDREERDFAKLDRLAHEHYLAELEGEQGGPHE
jgi:hypothetical protein